MMRENGKWRMEDGQWKIWGNHTDRVDSAQFNIFNQ